MNKFILIVFLSVIVASIGYAWYVYIDIKDYDVSITLDDTVYKTSNGEIQACVEAGDCPLAE